MDRVWIVFVEMSITASFVILCILPVRWLLRKAPKVFSYALWAVVLFRLLCPTAISSSFSLLGVLSVPLEAIRGESFTLDKGTYSGKGEIQGIEGNSGTGELGQKNINNTKAESRLDELKGADEDRISVRTVLAGLWLIGFGGLLFSSLVSVWRLRRRLVGAVRMRENIWLADRIASPFVIGIVRPQIYLPSTLSKEEQTYILLHEQTHIRRRDYLIKPLAFLALCLHWFNPLVWLAFFLAIRDMEMSCDESVLRRMGEEIRCDYSTSLLNLTIGNKGIFPGGSSVLTPTPLAFGEGDTKARIRNVLQYKKPAVWLLVAACVVVAALGIGLFCNPKQAEGQEEQNNFSAQTEERKDTKGSGESTLTAETMAGEKFIAENSRLCLRTDGGFEFNRHIATNYNPKGTWTVEGEELRLQGFMEGEQFLFHIQGETLVFVEGTDLVEKGTIYQKSDETKWALRPMIRVNGVLYLDTNKPIPVEMEESAILGTVTESVAGWEQPWKEGQTNFGMIGSPYAYYEDGVVVCYDHEWYFFERDQTEEAAGDPTEEIQTDVQTKVVSDPMWVPTEEEAIYMAILDHNRQTSETMEEEAPIRTSSWVKVGSTESGRTGEEPGTITYYLIGRFQEFEKQEPDLSGFRPSDSIEPGEYVLLPGNQRLLWVRVSLEEKEDIHHNKFYRHRTGYWQTEIEESALEAMKEEFREEFWEKASDYEQYQMALTQECYAQAVRASGMESFIQTRIDRLFNEVVSSPAESSNPGDYLKAHPAEIEELLYYGDYTRQYAKDWLEANGNTSLRGILLEWILEKLDFSF